MHRRYFKEKALRQLIDEHQSGKHDHGHRLWALLTFEVWHRDFRPRDQPMKLQADGGMTILRVLIRQGRPHIAHAHTANVGCPKSLAAGLAGASIAAQPYHGRLFHGRRFPIANRRLFLVTVAKITSRECPPLSLFAAAYCGPRRSLMRERWVSLIRAAAPTGALISPDLRRHTDGFVHQWMAPKAMEAAPC
jgi:hypothetical protein